MRISCSKHHTSAQLLASDVWPESKYTEFLPLLKLKGLFARILDEISSINKSKSQKNGKKRAASPAVLMQQAKRRRLSPTDGNLNGLDEDYDDSLPLFPAPTIYALPGQEKLPIWRHVFEMRYVDERGGDSEKSWTAEELEFRQILEALRVSFSEPATIDIGYSRIMDYAQKLTAAWGVRDGVACFSDWLLLPLVDDGCGYITTLQSCYELQREKKVHIEASMKVVVYPEGFHAINTKELPFEIRLEVVVSAWLPRFFEPLEKKETKRHTAFVDECKRQLCQFLYGRPSEQDCGDVDNIDIPFFYSILRSSTPLQSRLADEAMQPDALLPTLLPFQRRSVAWLLRREGKEITPDGNIIAKADDAEYSFWDEVHEGNHTWYYNRLGRTLSLAKPHLGVTFGGILAEEPGLGKTLETLALIMLNPAPEDRNPALIRFDPETGLNVKAVRTTLIVTPTALAGQWVDEIKAHAPSLKVLVYEGWSKVEVPIVNTSQERERVRKLLKIRKSKKSESKVNVGGALKGKGKGEGEGPAEGTGSVSMGADEEGGNTLDWASLVQQYDVVVTTYTVLRSDFNVARAAIKRPRREDVSYGSVDRPRSPLILVEWMRVVMDEVQMVGGGKIEDMVSLIPRLASLAVSGTPARSQVSDLSHVLKFLRVGNVIGSSQEWKSLFQPRNASEFVGFFQKYAIRTVKADVKDELTIPQQTRYLVGIELGPVERHIYNQTLETALNQLGLDAHGVASSAGWEVDVLLLRSSLRKLRAICTHPQVGQLLGRGDKLIRPGALKTMEAVLEDMKDKNWRTIMDDAKSKIQGLITLAQLQQQTEAPNRYHQASETLLLAEKEVNRWLEELQTAIREHDIKGEALKREVIVLQEAEYHDNGAREDCDEGERPEENKEISKEREKSLSPSEDGPEKGLPKTVAGEEHAFKRRAMQQRLREARLVLHRIKFLQGDVYHVLSGQHSADENEAYGSAEEIRRGLLRVAEVDANHVMGILEVARTKEGVLSTDLHIKIPFLDGDDSISQNSHDLLSEAHRIVEDVLNEQSALLWQWRTRIIDLLSQKLNPGEDEADGQEYQRTLDDQGEAETYLQVYAALLADRRESLLNERTLLAAHDIREKKLRQTIAAMKAGAALDMPQPEVPQDVELQPEHEVIHKELSEKRKEVLKRLNGRALRSVLIDLVDTTGINKFDKDPEKIWARGAVARLRRLIAEQEALQDKLDSDLALMRKAFNQRIVYFKQLQEISDSVVQAEWEGPLEDAIASEIAKNKESDTRITAGRARQRYLANLARNRGNIENEDDNDDACILCRCEFVRGFITQCAHIFCEGCMQTWIQRREGKTCPICRVNIDPDTVQRFTIGSKGTEQIPVAGPAPRSLRQVAYNMIDPEIFEEIQRIDAFGDYGSKVQTLVRHLLYFQANDPGSKSIVFSAWADSLHIVQAALHHNGIQCLRIDNLGGGGAAKRFRIDPEISVLLLHGERENAGLNVTCASRVFLLESVVHHGFELQAIARIDRLGQTRPTEVYCYYAEDTVERNILDLAARQGISLYTKDNAAGTLNISSFELDDAKVIDLPMKKKVQRGDFIFRIDDMLAILFPHMYEEVEFLIPPEDGSNCVGPSVSSAGQVNGVGHRVRPRQGNAVAGPSRLR